MKYNLLFNKVENTKMSTREMFSKMLQLVGSEKRSLLIAITVIFINSLLNLVAPFIIGDAVDKYVVSNNYDGVIRYAILLFVIFLVVSATGYAQTQLMGKVGQRMLYNLRNAVFTKLQDLPFAFFNQNKSGDLISRINNDTDKINQFFSHSLIQFTASIVSMIGAAGFLLSINLKLGLAALFPALVLWIFTRSISPLVKKKNAISLKSGGQLSAEIQESLSNFKVVVAFNRRDYFRDKFEGANSENYKKALIAGYLNTSLAPVYSLLANIGLLIVLAFGIFMILSGEFSIGLLISFLSYIVLFYNPLRQIAALWANFQVALACWDRISMILNLENDMPAVKDENNPANPSVIAFEDVSFAYQEGKDILKNTNLTLEKGKTYAFVGPTGGGKTTTASLISRLFDPNSGRILLNGKDLKSYSDEDRAMRIGFILQEPVLFTGSLMENIIYGHPIYQHLTETEVNELISKEGLGDLLNRFSGGLQLQINASGDGVSLGQRQLIAFMRAVLRKPDILILDEATANIDTVTEQLLESVLAKLPAKTTRIIIAHRLNTIENADEIYFVNSGQLIEAGSMQQAVDLLMHGKRQS